MKSLIAKALNGLAQLLAGLRPTLAQRFSIRAYHLDGAEALRYSGLPGPGALVLDLGAFEGDFAARCLAGGAKVWAFEPVAPFVKGLSRRFKGEPKARLFNFGLAGRPQKLRMVLDGPATRPGAKDQGLPVELKSAEAFFKAQRLGRAALLKINIEGGEFELLERLVQTPWIGRMQRLQIQFHPHVAGAVERRRALRQALARTHRLEWDYPWIWESWKLKA